MMNIRGNQGPISRGAMALSLATLFVLPAAAARALVTQPNGAVVPIDSLSGETQLHEFFAAQGEAIHWQNDAHDTPATFSPLCEFTATFMLKQAGSSLGVGWYNAIEGATVAPTAAEIHEIIPPGTPVGTVIDSTDIRNHPDYLGGSIGFALIRNPPHFSESRFNTYCDQLLCAATPGHWILGLSYKSTTVPNGYYMAFEDGDTTNFSWNNDGDYNDYVFLFSGIICTGAGEPCLVEGAEGICEAGLTECDAAGEIYCKQLNEPGDEACDGVDNDCDGEFDEGDDLCPPGEVCVRGVCVPYCGEEFPCDVGDVCENKVCVHADCVGVECEPGKACIEGVCLAPCDNIRCPEPQVCRLGRCVDPCRDVVCEEGYVCDGGACVTSCVCLSCEPGTVCSEDDGLCVPEDCLDVTCDPGTHCVQGACVDSCLDAVCPEGEVCQQGECVEASEPAPGDDAGAADSGAPDADGGAEAGVDGGGDGGRDPERPIDVNLENTDPACDCRALAPRSGGSAPTLLYLFALLAVLIRFTRRRP
jgi:hypothetical protein